MTVDELKGVMDDHISRIDGKIKDHEDHCTDRTKNIYARFTRIEIILYTGVGIVLTLQVLFTTGHIGG